MAKQPAAAEFMLEIDGYPAELGSVMTLSQRDPFPGGHTFELRFTIWKPFAGLEKAGNFETRTLTYDESSDVLMSIGMLYLPHDATRSPARYFLNLIKTMSIFDGRVVVAGVCSPCLKC